MIGACAKVVFLVMIASPAQEKQAGILVDSIRSFAGAYSNSPVYLVVTGTEPTLGESLHGRASKVIRLQMDEKYRSFPFADKVFACAQVEEMVEKEADWLVWLNPESLVLKEPALLAASPSIGALVRPVHIKNVGVGETEKADFFWKTIFAAAATQESSVWAVESSVDRQRLKAYFNSGFMGFRPSIGIYRAWKRAFEELLVNENLLARLCPDDAHKIFLHQALMSAITVSKLREEDIQVLPPEYGYPLLLHSSIPPDRRASNLGGLVTVIHDGRLAQLLAGIEVETQLKKWLRERGVEF
jgi:hypothetical protein